MKRAIQFSFYICFDSFCDYVERLDISSSLSHKMFGTSHLDHISVVCHRGNDVIYLDFRRLIRHALSIMAVNPLTVKTILDKLMFTKAKKVLNTPAFPDMPFLCAILVTDHLFLKAGIKFASALDMTSVSHLKFTGTLNGPVNTHGLLRSVE